MRVMIVDDAVMYRSQIRSALETCKDLQVVATAAHGRIAIEKLEQQSIDIITLDLAMPEMDGIQTLREIRKRGFKVKVVVFADEDGPMSRVLDALEAGATDFVSKPKLDTNADRNIEMIVKVLLPKVIQFKASPKSERKVNTVGAGKVMDSMSDSISVTSVESNPTYSKVDVQRFKPEIIVIGSSTGGPNALESIFAALKGRKLKLPIAIAQHMPAMFTKSLADRLSVLSGIECAEAKHGEVLKPGRVYIAPGDYHTTVSRVDGQVKLANDQGPKRNSVRPAVDNLFETAAQAYEKKVLAIVLTGMGEDGAVGCKAIKKAGGAVVIQDKESSVVWGMPGAVFQSGIQDRICTLDECSGLLIQLACA